MAYRLAVTAYLEGFELAEPSLAGSDRTLLRRTEQAMMAYRNAVKGGDSQQVEATHAAALGLLGALLHAQVGTVVPAGCYLGAPSALFLVDPRY